ncbi:Nitric oxide reductase subunit C [Neomoorella glycerini]|uniref:Nitric oxide reductase subunit C n=1 Tax=Neomoorella glycerini TaxID=55779 RepID=A0A6I5ZVW5_9FIRM|nr:c-type cytochrome [Moorella glycerini]QGP93607.1 Nitric oxide reductase subunit C [Moorella glycerini]
MRATWLYLAAIMVSLAFFTGAIFFSIRPALEEPWPQGAIAGKKIWQKNGCVECHTLLGNGGYAGVDLTRITANSSREELVTFLTRPPVMRPARRQRHPALAREEAERLLDYLEQVSKIDTRGWPPPPFTRTNPAKGE